MAMLDDDKHLWHLKQIINVGEKNEGELPSIRIELHFKLFLHTKLSLLTFIQN